MKRKLINGEPDKVLHSSCLVLISSSDVSIVSTSICYEVMGPDAMILVF